MNPNLLPTEMNIGNQERILRELQELPGKLLLLKQKLDKASQDLCALKINIQEKEYELESAKHIAASSVGFDMLKNDMQRRSHIFNCTHNIELQLNNMQQAYTDKEASIMPLKSDYDCTYQKLWALRTASEQIAAYMNYAAAGELP